MKSKISITVCSDLDYENLIAEITIDKNFFGIVTNEPSIGFCFEMPEGQVSGTPVSLDVFIEAIERAKNSLT